MTPADRATERWCKCPVSPRSYRQKQLLEIISKLSKATRSIYTNVFIFPYIVIYNQKLKLKQYNSTIQLNTYR